jgi:hypothetical protein
MDYLTGYNVNKGKNNQQLSQTPIYFTDKTYAIISNV